MTRRQIRLAVAQRLLAGLTATGWSESLYHPDNLGKDARSRVHLSFAVGVGQTMPHGSVKPDDGAVSTTGIRVRWIHRLAAGGAGGQVEDYEAALDEEQRLLVAALDELVRPELSMWFGGISEPRATGDGTYVVGEVRLVVGDLLPLT